MFSIFLPVAYFCLGFCGGAFLLRLRAARPRSLACNLDAAAVNSASMIGGCGQAGVGAGAGGGGARFSFTTLLFGTGFGLGCDRGRVVCTCLTKALPTSSQGEGPSTACVRRSTRALMAALSCVMAAAAAGSKHCRSWARQSLMDGGGASAMAAAARRLALSCARPAALEALRASVGVVLRGRDLMALMPRRRGGGVRLVVLRPPRAALPAGRACSALGAQGEPGSWALEPRARLDGDDAS